MKTVSILSFLLLTLGVDSFAQDLSGFALVAHYTLQETAEDLTGNQDTIQLINAPFQGTDGVYSFGAYLNNALGEDSTLIHTPKMEVLNDTAFAFQVEFRLDTIRPGKPIVVAGDLWRYLGMHINSDTTIRAMHNSVLYVTTSVPLNIDQWYTATLIHYKAGNGQTEYYLDDQLIFEIEGQLDHPENDINISNTHFGQGSSYRGFWRNLKVYEAAETSGVSQLRGRESLAVYPNPFCASFVIKEAQFMGAPYTISDQIGRMVVTGIMDYNEVRLTGLPAGIYYMRLVSPEGRIYLQVLEKLCD
ncbi:MAG: T9SS type A sorting domain-containing protein [Saprospirales bacterium]|nr:T9SS type A sorting domain-containing protein [Saprospirales bacterium]